jgi:hypothetical protein
LYLTEVHAGGHVPADGRPLPVGTALPSGVIAVFGYAMIAMELGSAAGDLD